MTQPPEPRRSQSATSLSRFYHGASSNGHGHGNGGANGGDEELADPALDFCNAFWGAGDKGYDVIMARLRGATRTTDELRAFWKERAAIEEDYAKRLSKLAKFPLGKDEIGDLASSLQNVITETSAQAMYHQSLCNDIKQTVEQPVAEFATRLSNLKKGLQASVEKSYRNKGLQEGHVAKAKERYESDCLKLNSYTANSALTQGKDLEKNQAKLDRVRQTIGANEQDFRQFVKVMEGTTAKWENEWRGFCDHVQDLEEDRLALMKDLIWAFANAVSQVCVEDDGSCERIREKLETFEPTNDIITFVRGWGTGDQIPDAPRFINYSAGEYPQHPTAHSANFRRLSSKPPPSAVSRTGGSQIPEPEPVSDAPQPYHHGQPNGLDDGIQRLALHDGPASDSHNAPPAQNTRPPFGGVALPGMAPTAAASELPERTSSRGPPMTPTMSMPEPRVPSRQGPPSPSARDITDESDPMAKALADLRRDPPGPGSIRRNASHRRTESAIPKSSSPGPNAAYNTNRMSYQQPPPASRQSVDMTLSPPAPGHTAAQLAKSMDDFHRSASRAADKRGSVNYSSYASDIVGAHPSSRPASPSGRAPSPAMMQPPTQPSTHIADEVLSQYHQAFPGERSERTRSRAASIASAGSRPGSIIGAPPPASYEPPRSPREGFVGIGAGGRRTPSPQPAFTSPVSNSHGALGPQNLGIALDKSGSVAHDSMAEAYRRQYEEQQQSQFGPPGHGSQQSHQQQHRQQQPGGGYGTQDSSGHGGAGGYRTTTGAGSHFGGSQRPTSGYGAPSPANPPYSQQQAPQQQYAPPPQQQQQQQQPYSYQPPPPQPAYQAHPSYQQSQQQQQYAQHTASPPPPANQAFTNGYGQQQQPPYSQHPPAQQYARTASPAPAPQQQNYGYRAPSPQPQQPPAPVYNRTPSPQPGYQQQQQQGGRSPSPQPGQAPSNAAPTGQWSTTGLPVLFYVKALYDYSAQSGAEFDFQSGDIIAVTSTPEDGWWSGELLDEARRIAGRTDFPSNFVCLF